MFFSSPEALADLKRPLEAGALYDEYVQDVELAITTLIDGCQWDEALRLVSLILTIFQSYS